MTELEKIERAKMYMDKLANGINPIDDTMAPDDDLINNVRLSRKEASLHILRYLSRPAKSPSG